MIAYFNNESYNLIFRFQNLALIDLRIRELIKIYHIIFEINKSILIIG